ncbi:hypothetical protein A7K94_0216665, partial [Modestobacter sp. VKM Ac-2676]
MELTDYLTVLRRHWRVWVATTLVGLALAVLHLVVTPSTYEASARVFVSVSPSIPNSAQFASQRIKSYPQVAVSRSVLAPVAGELDLGLDTRELLARVSASNPVDTSQVVVTVRGTSPEENATIANAVAQQLTEVVEDLETPSSGDRPVTLTVSDPAVAPVGPVAPVALHALALGLAAGLFPGLPPPSCGAGSIAVCTPRPTYGRHGEPTTASTCSPPGPAGSVATHSTGDRRPA